HEAHALAALRDLLQPLKPPMGVYGIFGNHDSPAFREQAGDLPVHWLVNDTVTLAEHELELWGLDTHLDKEGADSIAMLERRRRQPNGQPSSDRVAPAAAHRPFRLLMAHSPSHLPVA